MASVRAVIRQREPLVVTSRDCAHVVAPRSCSRPVDPVWSTRPDALRDSHVLSARSLGQYGRMRPGSAASTSSSIGPPAARGTRVVPRCRGTLSRSSRSRLAARRTRLCPAACGPFGLTRTSLCPTPAWHVRSLRAPPPSLGLLRLPSSPRPSHRRPWTGIRFTTGP